MLGLFRHHHTVDQHARNLDLPCRQGSAVGDPLDLHDHDPARVMGRHGNRLCFKRQRLSLHGDVAIGVCCRPAHDPYVDRERLIEKELLAINIHDAHQILLRLVIELSAAVARVDKRPQADARQRARFTRCDVPIEVGDNPLRQVVSFDLVGDGQLLQARHQPPVPADDARNQAFMPPVVQAARLSITLPGRVDQRQVARLATQLRIGGLRLQKELLQSHCDPLGETDTDEAAGGDRIATANQPRGIAGRDDFPGVGRVCRA